MSNLESGLTYVSAANVHTLAIRQALTGINALR